LTGKILAVYIEKADAKTSAMGAVDVQASSRTSESALPYSDYDELFMTVAAESGLHGNSSFLDNSILQDSTKSNNKISAKEIIPFLCKNCYKGN